jgi:hypothetical protein
MYLSQSAYHDVDLPSLKFNFATSHARWDPCTMTILGASHADIVLSLSFRSTSASHFSEVKFRPWIQNQSSQRRTNLALLHVPSSSSHPTSHFESRKSNQNLPSFCSCFADHASFANAKISFVVRQSFNLRASPPECPSRSFSR